MSSTWTYMGLHLNRPQNWYDIIILQSIKITWFKKKLHLPFHFLYRKWVHYQYKWCHTLCSTACQLNMAHLPHKYCPCIDLSHFNLGTVLHQWLAIDIPIMCQLLEPLLELLILLHNLKKLLQYKNLIQQCNTQATVTLQQITHWAMNPSPNTSSTSFRTITMKVLRTSTS